MANRFGLYYSRHGHTTQTETESSQETPPPSLDEVITQLESLYAVTKVDELIKIILNFLQWRTAGKYAEDKAESFRSVASRFIGSGETIFKFVNDNAEKSSTKGALRIIGDVLEKLKDVHWLLVGLAVIGYMLHTANKESENSKTCLDLLKKLVDFSNHVKKLNYTLEDQRKRLKLAIVMIVKGCILCASHMSSPKLSRFCKATGNVEDLSSFGKEIGSLCLNLISTTSVQVTDEESKYIGEDVFLSHSGKQKNFVRQLYKDLTREGVSCFFDESRQSLPLGEKWDTLIFEAAKTCRVAVLLLSMDFIRSKWPMLELTAFLKAKNFGENSNLKILPMFYKISPGDLMDITSDTQDITDRTRPEILENSLIEWNGISEETRTEWKKALREVRRFSGLRFKAGENKVSFREEIIKEIRTLLPPSPIVSSMPGSVGLGEGQEKVTIPLAQPTYPAWAVGLEEPVNQITKMLEIEKLKEGAEVMVIYGFGGIGKTTLADAVVANLKLEDINYTKIIIDEDHQKNDFTRMQQQLLKDLFPEYQHGRKITLRHCEEGRDHLTQAFQSETNKPVFIFIDNALRPEDLKELLPKDLTGLSQHSRILVTARDLSVTDLFEERGLSRKDYRVNTLKDKHGEKILCNDPIKLEQIKNDVKKILKICGGIPLALTIVGAQVKKQKYRADNCSEILQALEKGKEIKQEQLSERLLNFVYSRLETSAQEAFLDICSVLYIKDFSRRDAEYIVGVTEVASLEEASLITAVPFANSLDDIKKRGVYWEGEEHLIVHDVIRAKGRRMAEGTRIVEDAQPLSRAGEDQKVLQSIKGVRFNFYNKSSYILKESQLSCMSNSLRVFGLGQRMSITGRSGNTFQDLRYLVIGGDIPCLPVSLEALPRLAYYVGPIFKEGFSINKLPKSLRYLKARAQYTCDECATSEESNSIQTVQNSWLQELSLSELKSLPKLLEGIHQFIELKILSVHGWDEMEELPAQVCQLRSLNKLMMFEWKSLKRLPESFSNLTSLTHLDLNRCFKLEGLCSSFGELRGLRYLSLGGCEMLTELPDSFGQLIELEYLLLSWCTSLTILPHNFGQLTALKSLNLYNCKRLKQLPLSLGEVRSLQELDLSFCDELKELPSNFVQLTNLQVLKLGRREELGAGLSQMGNALKIQSTSCNS